MLVKFFKMVLIGFGKLGDFFRGILDHVVPLAMLASGLEDRRIGRQIRRIGHTLCLGCFQQKLASKCCGE